MSVLLLTDFTSVTVLTVLSHWNDNWKWNSCLLEIYAINLLDLPNSSALNWKRLNNWPGKTFQSLFLKIWTFNLLNWFLLSYNYGNRQRRIFAFCLQVVNIEFLKWQGWDNLNSRTSRSNTKANWTKIAWPNGSLTTIKICPVTTWTTWGNSKNLQLKINRNSTWITNQQLAEVTKKLIT